MFSLSISYLSEPRVAPDDCLVHCGGGGASSSPVPLVQGGERGVHLMLLALV